MPQLPLYRWESYSLSPVTFSHGSLPVSPQQSKHKLVSSAASVSTQSILTSTGLLLPGEADISNLPVRVAVLKLGLELKLVFVPFVIWQKLLVSVVHLSFLIRFAAVTSSTATQW